VLDVAKLMDDDIINQGKRQFDSVVIENNFVVSGTTSPSVLIICGASQPGFKGW